MFSRQQIINPLFRNYYLNSTKNYIRKMQNKSKESKIIKSLKTTQLGEFIIIPFFSFLSITSFILYYKFKK
jgi:hypothetical protein